MRMFTYHCQKCSADKKFKILSLVKRTPLTNVITAQCNTCKSPPIMLEYSNKLGFPDTSAKVLSKRKQILQAIEALLSLLHEYLAEEEEA